MALSESMITSETYIIRSKMGARTLCQLGYEIGTSELGEFMRKHGSPPEAADTDTDTDTDTSTATSAGEGEVSDPLPTESPCPMHRTATGL
jgi:hypothetical protein